MKYLIQTYLFLLPLFAIAQSDTTLYYLELNGGKSYYVYVLDKQDNVSVSAKYLNDSIRVHQWNEITALDSTMLTLDSTDVKMSLIRLRVEEENRINPKCTVIRSNNTKITGWITNSKDFSHTRNIVWVPASVQFVNTKGTKIIFEAEDIKEIDIEGQDKFLCIEEVYYRVVEDGIAKLLYRLHVRDLSAPASTGFGGVYTGSMHMGTIQDEKYYIYYKEILCKVCTVSSPVDGDKDSLGNPNYSREFKKKCLKIFVDCPELAKKIAAEEIESVDLRKVVVQFNECLMSK